MGEGTCNFKGPRGYIWYATVNSGTTDQMLLIYTVSARGTKADKDAVLASFDRSSDAESAVLRRPPSRAAAGTSRLAPRSGSRF